MKTQCPHCEVYYQDISPELIGQTALCDNCQQEFVIKDIDTPPPPPAKKQTPKRMSVSDYLNSQQSQKTKNKMVLTMDSGFFALDKILCVIANIICLIFVIISLLIKSDGFLVISGAIQGVLLIIYAFVLVKSKLTIENTSYIVTPELITVKSGWLNKAETTIRIADLREVSVEKPWCLTWYNLGNVLLSTSSGHGYEAVIAGVKDPDSVVRQITAWQKKS